MSWKLQARLGFSRVAILGCGVTRLDQVDKLMEWWTWSMSLVTRLATCLVDWQGDFHKFFYKNKFFIRKENTSILKLVNIEVIYKKEKENEKLGNMWLLNWCESFKWISMAWTWIWTYLTMSGVTYTLWCVELQVSCWLIHYIDENIGTCYWLWCFVVSLVKRLVFLLCTDNLVCVKNTS
jgi:hypothetical protein